MDAQSSAELTRLAIAARKEGDTAGAVQLLAQAIESDPQFEPAWLWLAACLIVRGEQRYCVEQALAINPESVQALNALPRFTDAIAVRPTALGEEALELPEEIEPFPEIKVVPPEAPIAAEPAPVAVAVSEVSNEVQQPAAAPYPGIAIQSTYLEPSAAPVPPRPASTPTQPLKPPKRKRRIWAAVLVVLVLSMVLVSGVTMIAAPAAVATYLTFMATQTPLPTPTPTCEVGLPAFVLELQPLAREWDDANAVAGSTPRMALAAQISNLQNVRRRVEDLSTPLCGAGMKDHLVRSMDATIEGYVAFLGQDLDSKVQKHFETAKLEMDAFQSFVTKILAGDSTS